MLEEPGFQLPSLHAMTVEIEGGYPAYERDETVPDLELPREICVVVVAIHGNQGPFCSTNAYLFTLSIFLSFLQTYWSMPRLSWVAPASCELQHP